MEFIIMQSATGVLAIATAVLLPKLIRFQLPALATTQGLMIGYGLVFGVIEPVVILVQYFLKQFSL